MGDAFQSWLVGKLNRTLTLAEYAAINAPPSSPKITSPVAVLNVPPQDSAGPGCGNSHAILPVRISIAFRMRSGLPPGARFWVPPRYSLPDCHVPGSRFV